MTHANISDRQYQYHAGSVLCAPGGSHVSFEDLGVLQLVLISVLKDTAVLLAVAILQFLEALV
jgi:hypothetical protein